MENLEDGQMVATRILPTFRRFYSVMMEEDPDTMMSILDSHHEIMQQHPRHWVYHYPAMAIRCERKDLLERNLLKHIHPPVALIEDLLYTQDIEIWKAVFKHISTIFVENHYYVKRVAEEHHHVGIETIVSRLDRIEIGKFIRTLWEHHIDPYAYRHVFKDTVQKHGVYTDDVEVIRFLIRCGVQIYNNPFDPWDGHPFQFDTLHDEALIAFLIDHAGADVNQLKMFNSRSHNVLAFTRYGIPLHTLDLGGHRDEILYDNVPFYTELVSQGYRLDFGAPWNAFFQKLRGPTLYQYCVRRFES